MSHFSLLLIWATAQTPAISSPPAELAYEGFYTKYVSFRGLPILASAKVEDAALIRISSTFGKMLSRVPKGTIEAMVGAGCHYSVIAEEEGQTDLPEYAHLRNDPKMDWNKRARGLGGRFTSGGEENILEYSTDRYYGESIYIHEFAHTLDEFGFAKSIPGFRAELDAAYRDAMKAGLWKNTYAATNAAEYWAEGVQSYFDCNRAAIPANGIHNEIFNRSGLQKYDPRLYRLIRRAFGGVAWRYDGKYNTTRGPVDKPTGPSSVD
jgi:alpha-glucosidase